MASGQQKPYHRLFLTVAAIVGLLLILQVTSPVQAASLSPRNPGPPNGFTTTTLLTRQIGTAPTFIMSLTLKQVGNYIITTYASFDINTSMPPSGTAKFAACGVFNGTRDIAFSDNTVPAQEVNIGIGAGPTSAMTTAASNFTGTISLRCTGSAPAGSVLVLHGQMTAIEVNTLTTQ